MHSAGCLTLPEARPHLPRPAHEPAVPPPLMPVAAAGLSGRPRCRIFPIGRTWNLQLEMPTGWLLGNGAFEPPPRLRFPSLGAAVNHAVIHGYDYRIITPGPLARFPYAERRLAREAWRDPRQH
jgi:hypothetical protein